MLPEIEVKAGRASLRRADDEKRWKCHLLREDCRARTALKDSTLVGKANFHCVLADLSATLAQTSDREPR